MRRHERSGEWLRASLATIWHACELRGDARAVALDPRLGGFTGVRVIADGSWGFAATSVMTEDAVADAARQATAIAKANEILLADDGETMLDVSSEASLQMESSPSAPDATTVLLSLWQHNMIGIRAERYINWGKRRPGSVQYIDSANYGN